MNTLAFRIIKNAAKHCSENEKCELVQKLVGDLYGTSHVAQKEGLLALEELALYSNSYGYLGDEIRDFVKEALCSVVYSVNIEELRKQLECKLCSFGEDSFEAYLCSIVMIGVVGIYVGYKEEKVLEYVLKCVPSAIRKEIEEKIAQKAAKKNGQQKVSDVLQYAEEHCFENEKCMQVQKLAESMYWTSYVAQRNGLFALEEQANNYEYLGNEAKDFVKNALYSVVDAMDPKKLMEKLEYRICSLGIETFDAYLCYLAMIGILSIQSGDKERVVLNKVLEYIPEACKKAAEEKIDEEERRRREEYEKQMSGWTNELQLTSDNEILRQINADIKDISEWDIERIAREVRDEELVELLPYFEPEKRISFAKAFPEERRNIILEGIRQKVKKENNDEVVLLKALLSFREIFFRLKRYGEIF